jgi:hypothetical protein
MISVKKIIFIAFVINKLLGKEEIDGIYEKAEELG